MTRQELIDETASIARRHAKSLPPWPHLRVGARVRHIHLGEGFVAFVDDRVALITYDSRASGWSAHDRDWFSIYPDDLTLLPAGLAA